MAMLKMATQNQYRITPAKSRMAPGSHPSEPQFVSAETFLHTLSRERRRTERSGRSFLLVLISGEELRGGAGELAVRGAFRRFLPAYGKRMCLAGTNSQLRSGS